MKSKSIQIDDSVRTVVVIGPITTTGPVREAWAVEQARRAGKQLQVLNLTRHIRRYVSSTLSQAATHARRPLLLQKPGSVSGSTLPGVSKRSVMKSPHGSTSEVADEAQQTQKYRP